MALTGLLEGKTVLVNGGTQGLGRGIALTAAEQGASAVAVTGRSREQGDAVAAELARAGLRACFLAVDLSEIEGARSSVRGTVAAFGQVDVVVNAAGTTTRGTMLDTTPEVFDAHIALNLRAPFFVMQEAIAHLRGRGVGGSILNIVTMAQHGGQPYLAPYVASKAGLAGLVRNAAFAHRWDRIRINGLNIGWTDTVGEDAVQRGFHGAGDDWRAKAYAAQPMGKLGQVDEIADFAAFLVSERSGVVTGSVIDWDQTVPGASE